MSSATEKLIPRCPTCVKYGINANLTVKCEGCKELKKGISALCNKCAIDLKKCEICGSGYKTGNEYVAVFKQETETFLDYCRSNLKTDYAKTNDGLETRRKICAKFVKYFSNVPADKIPSTVYKYVNNK